MAGRPIRKAGAMTIPAVLYIHAMTICDSMPAMKKEDSDLAV